MSGALGSFADYLLPNLILMKRVSGCRRQKALAGGGKEGQAEAEEPQPETKLESSDAPAISASEQEKVTMKTLLESQILPLSHSDLLSYVEV